MTLLQSVILGLIQGITEFLPVSSSGHLAIFNVLFGLDSGDNIVAFNLLLHLGTLIAVFIVYYKDIWALIKAVLSLCGKIFTGKVKNGLSGDERFVVWVVVATLPLVVLKLTGLDSILEFLSTSILAVGIILLFNGAVLFVSDKFSRGNTAIEETKWYNALAVGICQMFAALLPGLSRSGSTITGGLLNGLDRQSAVRFSFILSIPAIIGASIFEVPDLFESATSSSEWVIYLVGMAVSAVVGVAAMRLLNYISKHSNFRMFSYYCWAAGAVAIGYQIVQWVR